MVIIWMVLVLIEVRIRIARIIKLVRSDSILKEAFLLAGSAC